MVQIRTQHWRTGTTLSSRRLDMGTPSAFRKSQTFRLNTKRPTSSLPNLDFEPTSIFPSLIRSSTCALLSPPIKHFAGKLLLHLALLLKPACNKKTIGGKLMWKAQGDVFLAAVHEDGGRLSETAKTLLNRLARHFSCITSEQSFYIPYALQRLHD